MALRPLKLFYTGVWATGYRKIKDDFLRLTMKNINLSVFADNTFSLKVADVVSEGLTMSAFIMTGKADILYTSCGDVDEIVVYDISHDGAVLDNQHTFSISKKKCTRLPIPEGEAFFCFSSRLPAPDAQALASSVPVVDFQCFESFAESQSPEEFSYDCPTPSRGLDDFQFDDLFESFETQY